MFLMQTVTLVDITKEIPRPYWVIFRLIMAVLLPLSYKLLSRLFIPDDPDGEAVVWSMMSKKEGKDKNKKK